MNYKDYIASPDHGCAVVVHRGLWNDAPENSLLAVERTIDAGHRVVEVDVRKTADGALVLLHDDTFLRMTGLDRAPEGLTLKQISDLRLRNRDGGEGNIISDEPVPTLEQLFDVTRGRLFIHLDVKHRQVIPEVLAAAKRAGVLGQVDFWNNLRTAEDLTWFREVFDGHDVVVMPKTRLNAPDAEYQLDLAFDLKPVVCEFVYDTLSDIEAVRERFSKAGIATWCNTLDGVACGGHTDTAALDRPKEVWGSLLDVGVSMIQTDYAAHLDAFLLDRTSGGRA